YRDADDGYHRGDGDREFYRRVYRQGFQTGYNEAYNRNARDWRGSYPPYPTYPSNPSYPSYPTYPSNSGVYGSVAAQNGYRDGLEAGRDAAHDRERYDVLIERRYREGDRGYDRRYGPRDQYQREYRAAFEQGYRDGYARQ